MNDEINVMSEGVFGSGGKVGGWMKDEWRILNERKTSDAGNSGRRRRTRRKKIGRRERTRTRRGRKA